MPMKFVDLRLSSEAGCGTVAKQTQGRLFSFRGGSLLLGRLLPRTTMDIFCVDTEVSTDDFTQLLSIMHQLVHVACADIRH